MWCACHNQFSISGFSVLYLTPVPYCMLSTSNQFFASVWCLFWCSIAVFCKFLMFSMWRTCCDYEVYTSMWSHYAALSSYCIYYYPEIKFFIVTKVENINILCSERSVEHNSVLCYLHNPEKSIFESFKFRAKFACVYGIPNQIVI